MTNMEEQIKLRFHGADILNLEFNVIKFMDGDTKIDIKTTSKVFFPPELPLVFKILMDIKLSTNGYFDLNIIAVGNFEINLELEPEIKKNFINVNAPAIMFPYIRSFITTFSANVGLPLQTLHIPVQFFHGEIEELKKEEQDIIKHDK